MTTKARRRYTYLAVALAIVLLIALIWRSRTVEEVQVVLNFEGQPSIN